MIPGFGESLPEIKHLLKNHKSMEVEILVHDHCCKELIKIGEDLADKGGDNADNILTRCSNVGQILVIHEKFD